MSDRDVFELLSYLKFSAYAPSVNQISDHKTENDEDILRAASLRTIEEDAQEDAIWAEYM